METPLEGIARERESLGTGSAWKHDFSKGLISYMREQKCRPMPLRGKGQRIREGALGQTRLLFSSAKSRARFIVQGGVSKAELSISKA